MNSCQSCQTCWELWSNDYTEFKPLVSVRWVPDLFFSLAAQICLNFRLLGFPYSQSLILPFAFLMNDQASVVLDLLESTLTEVTISEGGQTHQVQRSGLEVFTRKWVEDAETFQGFWAQRVRWVQLESMILLGMAWHYPFFASLCSFSIIALTKLLESRRPALDGIIVPGDLIPDTSNGETNEVATPPSPCWLPSIPPLSSSCSHSDPFQS